jgi:hypothetical protein
MNNASKTVGERGDDHDGAEMEPGLDGADLRRALDSAGELARESPHMALGVALAAGFVLGGGLTPRLLGSLAMIAGRTYLGRAMRETMSTVIEEQIAAARG